MRGLRGRLLLAAGSVLAGALLIELGATAWLHLLASEQQFRHHASLEQLRARAATQGRPAGRYVPHRYIGYVPAPDFLDGEDRHNDLGYRGEAFPERKPLGEYRIVCLGGSTTYTSFVRDAGRAYPALLQEELRARGYDQVRVVNAGVPGYSTYETLLNYLFRVADLQPDLLLVYHGINDAGIRLVWPPPAYLGDNSGYMGPGGRWFGRTPLLQRSNAMRMVLLRLGRISSATVLAESFGQVQPTAKTFTYYGQITDGSYPQRIFARVSAKRMLQENPPVHFRRNLEALIAVAAARGAGTVLATFAVNREMGDATTSAALIQGIEQQNRVIHDLARLPGVQVIDYAAMAPTDRSLYWDGVHLLEPGVKRKAEIFADLLVDRVLPPSPPQLQAAFDSAAEVLLRLGAESGFAGVTGHRDTAIGQAPEGLAITGAPRRLRLPPMRGSGGEFGAIARIGVRSSGESWLRVFYVTREERRYARERSLVRPLQAGAAVVLLALPSEAKGRLRIDLGPAEGEHLLTEVEVRGLATEPEGGR